MHKKSNLKQEATSFEISGFCLLQTNKEQKRSARISQN
jgi:hypothetical protein